MSIHSIAAAIKKIIYAKGEPYLFSHSTLKFYPGTRPIKRKYINANNDVVRNDVLQINYFEKHFKPNDIFWDLGSHNGHYSIFAASIVNGNNQVFSFEPDPVASKVQEANIKLNNFQQKINLLKIAVSNTNGILLFDAQDGNSTSHIIKNKQVGKGTVVEVSTKTIDTLLQELPEPTFIKIDTEGAEIDILKTADILLANPNIKFICELHPFAWDGFGVKYQEFTDILKKHNRTLSLLDTNKKIADLPYYGTVLF